MANAVDHQPSFETPRLRLRPLTGRDAKDLHSVFSDPETTRYLDFATCGARGRRKKYRLR